VFTSKNYFYSRTKVIFRDRGIKGREGHNDKLSPASAVLAWKMVMVIVAMLFSSTKFAS